MAEKASKVKEKNAFYTSIGMAQNNMVQRHGEAASQMVQAYKGTRYDSMGNELEFHGRSLKEISNYKTNPNYYEQNQKQQSGFSAELIKEARDNKENILNGNPNRTRTTDGQGRTNDTKYDHIVVDKYGNEVSGSGSQMKFLATGIDKDGDRTFKVVDKIAKDESWDRYDVIDVPKGDYEDALKYADKQANKLEEQAKHAREHGKDALAEKYEKQAEEYRKAKDKLRESNVTAEEALAARREALKFVVKEVMHDSHNAGLQAARGAAIYSATFSIGQNMVQVITEDKPLDEAAIEVVETTAKSTATAYGVTYAGTTLKAIMHTSKNELIRKLGTTNLPTAIVTGGLEVTKSMIRYGKGEINELELIEELGEKGTGMIASGYGAAVGAELGATIGTVIFPGLGTGIGAVAGVIGGMIAYQMSGAIYHGAIDALKGQRIAAERRAVLEELAEIAIAQNREYRRQLEEYAQKKLNETEKQIEKLFNIVESSIIENDADNFIKAMNGFGEMFHIKLQFQSFEEFDEFMSDESTILIL